MVEKARGQEAEKRTRVLEIGRGGRPADKLGGTLFQGDNIQYVGIDLPQEIQSHWDTTNMIGANAAHMPFRDDSFDYILMRSIFGQYTSDLAVSDIDDIRTWGMCEAFRVLKPGGTIAISEENTPWYIQYVESYLKDVGFKVTDYAQLKQLYEETPEDDKYRTLRSQFYNNEPTMAGPTYWGYPFVMIAEKPEEPEYKELSGEVRRFPVFRNQIHTVWAGQNCWKRSETELLATVIFKRGKENTDPDIVPPRFS